MRRGTGAGDELEHANDILLNNRWLGSNPYSILVRTFSELSHLRELTGGDRGNGIRMSCILAPGFFFLFPSYCS